MAISRSTYYDAPVSAPDDTAASRRSPQSAMSSNITVGGASRPPCDSRE